MFVFIYSSIKLSEEMPSHYFCGCGFEGFKNSHAWPRGRRGSEPLVWARTYSTKQHVECPLLSSISWLWRAQTTATPLTHTATHCHTHTQRKVCVASSAQTSAAARTQSASSLWIYSLFLIHFLNTKHRHYVVDGESSLQEILHLVRE